MPTPRPTIPELHRHGICVASRTTTFVTEIDDDGRMRGTVERDIHINVRTHWLKSAERQPVDWACEVLEGVPFLGGDVHVFTVQEPPSEAYIYALLNGMFEEDGRPVIHEDGSIPCPGGASWGRFYDEALDPNMTDEVLEALRESDFDNPWFVEPSQDVDEHGVARSTFSRHTGRVWLVGGAWTTEDAALLEEMAMIDGPFYVFGPDDQIRPAHPWDPNGSLP